MADPRLVQHCRLCRKLHDVSEFPELLGICHDCYDIVMYWINENGWAISLQKVPIEYRQPTPIIKTFPLTSSKESAKKGASQKRNRP